MRESERWQQIKQVLHHALEREPSERADLLSWRFSISIWAICTVLWPRVRRTPLTSNWKVGATLDTGINRAWTSGLTCESRHPDWSRCRPN